MTIGKYTDLSYGTSLITHSEEKMLKILHNFQNYDLYLDS